MTAAWRLIFAIIGFLGVLSVVFFLTWHRLLAKQQGMPLDEFEPAARQSDLLNAQDKEAQANRESSKANV